MLGKLQQFYFSYNRILEFKLRNFVIYFDFVIAGSKSINSFTISKLVSIVKSSFNIFLNLSSCKTNIKIFCNDSFLPFSKEQNVQKQSKRCSVSSCIRVFEGFGDILLTLSMVQTFLLNWQTPLLAYHRLMQRGRLHDTIL